MLRSLCCTTVFVLLSILTSYTQNWEIVCEADICTESFTGYGTGDPNASPIVTAQGFVLNGYGSSGGANDYAAWAQNISVLGQTHWIWPRTTSLILNPGS